MHRISLWESHRKQIPSSYRKWKNKIIAGSKNSRIIRGFYWYKMLSVAVLNFVSLVKYLLLVFTCRCTLFTHRMLVGRELQNMTLFREKQPQGTIDVWWLYDDGGENNTNASANLTWRLVRDTKIRTFQIESTTDMTSFSFNAQESLWTEIYNGTLRDFLSPLIWRHKLRYNQQWR